MSNLCAMACEGGLPEHGPSNPTSGISLSGIPEAPVYYPTEEEFGDPLAYIEKIRPEAETYGICKVVPPKRWKPPFAIDKKSFSFPTKLQAIHHLQKRSAAHDAETFRLEYSRFLRREGFKIGDWPHFQGKELDLCKLFSAVKRHGGFQNVTKENKWGDVLQILDPSYLQSESQQSALKKVYENHLYDFEVFQAKSSSRKRSRSFHEQEPKSYLRGKKSRRCCSVLESHVKEESQVENSRNDQICEQCQSGAHEQFILLCDRCDRGWHIFCLTPPLSSIPPGNWYCFDCLTSEKESFGFTTGEMHTFDSFRKVAERFRKRWFGAKEASFSEIEEEFWSVVERQKGAVEVLYGSDLASEVYGSGFPRPSDPIPDWADQTSWSEYAKSPWNLNNFTKLEGSILKHVQENIPGVTVPWVYMGMLFSSFCWHYEDQCFYSINYLHWGEPKCWYGVPGAAIDAFEQVMHKTFPDLFEAQPDLLFQLVTMLNPKVLHDNKVPVYRTIQEPGNFVITFPRSYHGGFNHGLNCAEAVNFATLDWLPFGRFGVERTRLYHKEAVLCHEELLCVIAKNAQNYAKSSHWLKDEFKDMITLERKQRVQLWRSGIARSSRLSPRKFPDVIGTEEDPQCVICQYHLFLSALTCSCCPGRLVCLQHSEQLCECNKDRQQLLYRYSLAELDDLQKYILCLDTESEKPCETMSKPKKRGRPLNSFSTTKKVNGNMISQTKLAEAWCGKAQKLLKKNPKLSAIESLLVEAEQFFWGGHDMDCVNKLGKQLLSAQQWAQSVTACIAPSDVKLEEQKYSKKSYLATAQNLLSINPSPCDMEGSLKKLKELIDATLPLQKQVQTLFSRSLPWQLPELEELQYKVTQSPLIFPEGEKLEKLVASIHVWRVTVQNLLSEPRKAWISGDKNNTDMEKLHMLQSEAEKLCVVLPEMKILDAYICKLKKWQERAKMLLLESTLPMKVVEDFLSEIDDVPVYFLESEILERRVHEANEWVYSTHKVLADVKHQKYYLSSIELLSALLRCGESLKIEVKELEHVKSELQRLSWLERASKGMKSQLPCTELIELLKDAQSLSLENEDEYIEISRLVEAACAWEAKASKFLQEGASLEDYKSLQRDSVKIYVSLSGWIDINLEILQAESFLRDMEPLLTPSQNGKTALNFTLIQDLIDQSQKFKVCFPERTFSHAIFNNILSWKNRAADIICHAKNVLQSSQLMDQLSLEVAAGPKSKVVLENESLLADMKTIVYEGNELGFDLSELETLNVLVTAAEWNLKVCQLLLKHPTVEELESLVKEANAFSDYIGQFDQLQCVIDDGKKWSEKLKKILNLDSPIKCNVHELEALLVEGKALHMDMCNEVAHLEQLLASHKARQSQIVMCLNSPVQSISIEELVQLHEISTTSKIAFDASEVLASEVMKVQTWLSICHAKLLVRQDFTSASLMEILLKIKTSVENALHQLRKKTYIEGHYSYVEGNELCHLCKNNIDYENCSLITCDDCSDRYHTSCLEWEDSQEWVQNSFVCSFCNAFKAGILWLDEDVLSKICITKRPTRNALMDLLQAAEDIQFRLKEVELLERIIGSVQEWESCLQSLTEPILRSHANPKNSSSSLLSALKIAGTMEIRSDGNCQLALALSVNAWRMQATSIMESSTKPSYRTVCRVLKEGLAISVLSHDCVLKDLKTWETMASVWLSQAKMAVEDDGAMPLEDVQKLIVEGERLPVAFSKELADLRSRTILYCICRKPYDKERAMIACDSCSEWYHFDCVNLPEPDCSDDEGPDMIQRFGSVGEFVCPNCKPADGSDTVVEESSVNSRNSQHSSVSSTPPLWYARRKRSDRVSVRVRGNLQERWQSPKMNYYPKVLARGTEADGQTVVSANGRPCRRTAGQNSRFESFVLLTHPG